MCKIIVGRKNIIKTIFTSCLFLFLFGCGKPSFETDTLVFNKDGSINEYLVEDFDTAVYSFEELKADTESFISEYNASHKYTIELVELITDNQIIKSNIKYSDDSSYYDFNNLPLFYGTVAKAFKAGYSLSTPMVSIDDGKTVNISSNRDLDNSHIIILNIATNVNTYKDIKYATDNVKVSDDHKTATVEGGSTAYIVFD